MWRGRNNKEGCDSLLVLGGRVGGVGEEWRRPSLLPRGNKEAARGDVFFLAVTRSQVQEEQSRDPASGR